MQLDSLSFGMPEILNLRTISDDELLRRLSELTWSSRRVEADVVTHVAEADARRLYAREACSSMFDYCRQVLHLRENEAYLRITVARASREHPLLLAMLRDGRLHLSGIATLARHLTLENRDEVLNRAAGMSHREVKELARELEPLPDAPSTIRKLPERSARTSPAHSAQLGAHRVEASAPGLLPGGFVVPGQAGDPARAGEPAPDPSVQRVEGLDHERPAARAETSPRPPSPRRPVMEPLSPGRYRVSFTADTSLRDKLERLQALMRSSVPDGDLTAIIEQVVTEKLERLEAKRFAKARIPRKTLAESRTAPTSRYIPAAVRRVVHERDGSRCTFVDDHGRQCRKRHDLEFHHRKPFGRGGDHSPDVLALMCKTHNLLMAEQDYGEEKMTRHRRSAIRVFEPAASYVVGIVR